MEFDAPYSIDINILVLYIDGFLKSFCWYQKTKTVQMNGSCFCVLSYLKCAFLKSEEEKVNCSYHVKQSSWF